jgi:putative lipoic acid-binding regulatory protein
MNQEWIDNFRKKLDEHHTWPSTYIFKFIVPAEKVEEVKALFPEHTVREKISKEGKYIGVTIEAEMANSDAVIQYYVAASHIEGIVAL